MPQKKPIAVPSAGPNIDNKPTATASAKSADIDVKAKAQRDALRQRINRNARHLIQGSWDDLEPKYKPTGGPAKEDAEWKALRETEDRLLARSAKIKNTKDEGQCQYYAAVATRKEFLDIASKTPEPIKPAVLLQPPPPPAPKQPAPSPANTPRSNMARESGERRKGFQSNYYVGGDDVDDEEPEREPSEFDPTEDNSALRDERRQKRKAEGDPDEAEFLLQIEEVEMKAKLAILQIRRKMAAAKKRRVAVKQEKNA